MDLKELLETSELLKQTIKAMIAAYGKEEQSEAASETFRGSFLKGATLKKYSESDEAMRRLMYNIYNSAKEFSLWVPIDDNELFEPSWRVDE